MPGDGYFLHRGYGDASGQSKAGRPEREAEILHDAVVWNLSLYRHRRGRGILGRGGTSDFCYGYSLLYRPGIRQRRRGALEYGPVFHAVGPDALRYLRGDGCDSGLSDPEQGRAVQDQFPADSLDGQGRGEEQVGGRVRRLVCLRSDGCCGRRSGLRRNAAFLRREGLCRDSAQHHDLRGHYRRHVCLL